MRKYDDADLVVIKNYGCNQQMILYELPFAVINMLNQHTGRKITTIFSGKLPRGNSMIKHEVDLSSGIYFVKIAGTTRYNVKKVVIVG